MADRSEMARNAIESEFRTCIQNGLTKLKLRIDMKWSEMRLKVKFRHPKWPTSAILSKISKKLVAYRCEMDRNEIESDFRTSKMVTGSHFVQNLKKICIYLKWPEM